MKNKINQKKNQNLLKHGKKSNAQGVVSNPLRNDVASCEDPVDSRSNMDENALPSGIIGMSIKNITKSNKVESKKHAISPSLTK